MRGRDCGIIIRGMKRKAALHNLGCKVNEYELEKMARSLAEAGYEIVPFEPGADVYVINTCTVTNIADRKSRQMLHRARSMNPDAVVAAVGCYVDIREAELKKDPMIDLCLPNAEKGNIAGALASYFKEREPAGEPALTPVETAGERTRAFIKIEDGCDRFCSYCIIPYARGPVRVRPQEEVLAEIREKAERGCREAVLTGIQIGAYGADPLADLAEAAAKIPGIERIRLGSLEPQLMTERFIARLSENEAVCPQFHVALQSGCDETLRRMNRHYTTEEYAGICGILRDRFRDPAITTDLIVGFPGESEEEFAATCAFLERIAFARVHIFRYAQREGTKAARMGGQIPEGVKTARSKAAETVTSATAAAYARRFEHSVQPVLFEEKKTLSDGDYWTGYTREYLQVFMKSEEDLSNRILPCLLTAGPDGTLRGERRGTEDGK